MANKHHYVKKGYICEVCKEFTSMSPSYFGTSMPGNAFENIPKHAWGCEGYMRPVTYYPAEITVEWNDEK